MTAHPAIAAVPKIGSEDNPDRSLLQSFLVGRLIYWMAADENVAAFDARSDGLGDYVPVIFKGGSFFERDPDDTTTEADGETVLVTADGSRYKITFDDLLFGFSVLSRSVTVPPDPEDEDEEARPSFGDAYLVPSGASGDWADKEDDLAIFTPRDWVFVGPRDGRLIRVRDEKAFVHYDVDEGEWVTGFGSQALPNASVSMAALIGVAASLTIRVENQTTNSPPSTWSKGVSYIIGPSASGDWSGHAGKVAYAIADGVLADGDEFVILTPQHGDKVFDKSLGYDVQWNGSAWVSAAGSWIGIATPVFTSSGVGSQTAASGGTSYTYSVSSGPSTSVRARRDDASISYAAKNAGTKNLLLTWDVDMTITHNSGSGLTGNIVVAVFRDSETNSIAWQRIKYPEAKIGAADALIFNATHQFWLDAPDTSLHTYHLRVTSIVASIAAQSVDATAFARRTLTLAERAP